MRTTTGRLAVLAILAIPRASAAGWDIETIVPFGNHADLAVDTSGQPHILFDNCVAWELCLSAEPSELTYGTRGTSGWSFETVAGHPAGFLTSIVIDASGKPHIAYCDSTWQMHYGVRDGGAWTIENLDHPHPSYYRASPALTLDTNGEPHISFIEGESVQYAHRVGGLWTDEDVTGSWLDNWSARAAIAIDNTDSVRIGTWQYYQSAVLFTRGASSWSADYIGGAAGYNPWMVLDANDTAHFVYHGSGVYYATNAGGGWTEELVDPQGSNEPDDIALDAGGSPFVVYTRVVPVSYNPPYLYNLDVFLAWHDNGAWATDLIASADSVEEWRTDPRVEIDDFGTIHVLYRDPETGALLYGTRDVPTSVTDTPPFRVNAITGVVPNPFNPSTEVIFRLSTDERATLVVYDVLGRRVRSLVDARTRAGEHRVGWDGRTDAGTAAASGVYFFRLTTTHGAYTRRGVLAK